MAQSPALLRLSVDVLSAALAEAGTAPACLACRRLLEAARRVGPLVCAPAASVARFAWARRLGCRWSAERTSRQACASGCLELLRATDFQPGAAHVTAADRHMHVQEWLWPRMERHPLAPLRFAMCSRDVREWAAARGHRTLDMSGWFNLRSLSSADWIEIFPPEGDVREHWLDRMKPHLDRAAQDPVWCQNVAWCPHPTYWWRRRFSASEDAPEDGVVWIRVGRWWDVIYDLRPLGEYGLLVRDLPHLSRAVVTRETAIHLQFAMFSAVEVGCVVDGPGPVGFEASVVMFPLCESQSEHGYHDGHVGVSAELRCLTRLDGDDDLLPGSTYGDRAVDDSRA